jgi:hypothetical protein
MGGDTRQDDPRFADNRQERQSPVLLESVQAKFLAAPTYGLIVPAVHQFYRFKQTRNLFHDE